MKWADLLNANRNLGNLKVALIIIGCEHGQDQKRPYVALKPGIIHE